MSRATAAETIIVRPSNNMYTVLALIGVIACALALLVIFARAKTLGVPLLPV
jgi:NADH:ubiquinone oxidoreductase subunit 6 (subunit J)